MLRKTKRAGKRSSLNCFNNDIVHFWNIGIGRKDSRRVVKAEAVVRFSPDITPLARGGRRDPAARASRRDRYAVVARRRRRDPVAPDHAGHTDDPFRRVHLGEPSKIDVPINSRHLSRSKAGEVARGRSGRVARKAMEKKRPGLVAYLRTFPGEMFERNRASSRTIDP